MTSAEKAQAIMGKNYYGPEVLTAVAPLIFLDLPAVTPPVPWSVVVLEKAKRTHLLVWGASKTGTNKPLTICTLRDQFGALPQPNLPAFYNQDWYLREKFATKTTPGGRWYLVPLAVNSKTRGLAPVRAEKQIPKYATLPPAVVLAYTFILHFLVTGGQKLWCHDFVWCADHDSNGDQIYVGRYDDPIGKSKSGFNIHRHLSIRRAYGCLNFYE